jgi:hypothetical protein
LRVLAATLTILGGVAPAIALDYDGALARSDAASAAVSPITR